jgi:hypothetical protein
MNLGRAAQRVLGGNTIDQYSDGGGGYMSLSWAECSQHCTPELLSQIYPTVTPPPPTSTQITYICT